MPDYYPFDPTPRRPAVLPPAGTIDSQFHVLGDPATYPTRPGAAYHMPSATWERARHVHNQLGVTRGIIVQTTTYLVHTTDAPKVSAARHRWFTGPVPPTHTIVGVAALGRPAFLVEIEATAYLG